MQIPPPPPPPLRLSIVRGGTFLFLIKIFQNIWVPSWSLLDFSSKDKRLFNQFRIWNFKIWSSLVPLKTNYHSQVSEDNIYLGMEILDVGWTQCVQTFQGIFNFTPNLKRKLYNFDKFLLKRIYGICFRDSKILMVKKHIFLRDYAEI